MGVKRFFQGPYEFRPIEFLLIVCIGWYVYAHPTEVKATFACFKQTAQPEK